MPPRNATYSSRYEGPRGTKVRLLHGRSRGLYNERVSRATAVSTLLLPLNNLRLLLRSVARLLEPRAVAWIKRWPSYMHIITCFSASTGIYRIMRI